MHHVSIGIIQEISKLLFLIIFKEGDIGGTQYRNTVRNKTLRSVHFGVVVVELIIWKCVDIVRNEIW